MVRANVQAFTLEQLYAGLVRAQQQAHGADYTLHHDVIRSAAVECRSYLELGINQGTTLAAALLAGFEWVFGVDMNLSRMDPHSELFWIYAREWPKQRLELFPQDSRMPINQTVDFLFIDSRHEPKHLQQELDVHGPNVRRYILIHDTTAVPALAKVAEAWATTHNATVQHRETRNVGFMLLSVAK